MPKFAQILSSPRHLGELIESVRPLHQLIELICPSECVWCERQLSDQHTICRTCWGLFEAPYHACLRCGSQLPETMPVDSCVRCRKQNFGFDEVVVLGPYRSQFQQAVLLSKKRQHEKLRRVMADLMASRLQSRLANNKEDGRNQPVIMAVPDHWSRRLGTGRAMTAYSLAWQISKTLNLPILERTIVRIRKTSKQGLLPWSQRGQNVRGAFEITDTDALNGRHVVLVDDVLTSGATTSEISKMLRGAGARKVTVSVIARGTGIRE